MKHNTKKEISKIPNTFNLNEELLKNLYFSSSKKYLIFQDNFYFLVSDIVKVIQEKQGNVRFYNGKRGMEYQSNFSFRKNSFFNNHMIGCQIIQEEKLNEFIKWSKSNGVKFK